MAEPTTTLAAIGLPPDEAIAYFRRKANVGTDHWTDVWQEAHARAFSVAGAASAALVEDFRQAVGRALEQGTTIAEFRRDFDSIVARHGWSYNGGPGWRANIIYETNLSVAYSAGRYAQMTEPATLAAFPYWRYQHNHAVHPRPQHEAWSGLVLRTDDPWWSTHYPPNGWRCHCSAEPVSGGQLARGVVGQNRQIVTAPETAPPVDNRPWTNPRTGQVVQVPHGIDPGFGYNPGEAWLRGPGAPLPPAQGGPPPKAPKPPASVPRAAPVAPPALPEAPPLPPLQPIPAAPYGPAARLLSVPHAAPDFAEWAQAQLVPAPGGGMMASGRVDGSSRIVGRFSAAVEHGLATAMRALGRDYAAPASTDISLPSSVFQHLARQSKIGTGREIATAEMLRLPELLASPRAVLLEISTGRVFYVIDSVNAVAGQSAAVVPVVLGSTRKVRGFGLRAPLRLNEIRTVTIVREAPLGAAAEFVLLDGTL